MSKEKWTWKGHTAPLGETGDYDSWIEISNGEQSFICRDADDDQLNQFCELLDVIDIENYNPTEYVLLYELEQAKAELEHYKALAEAADEYIHSLEGKQDYGHGYDYNHEQYKNEYQKLKAK